MLLVANTNFKDLLCKLFKIIVFYILFLIPLITLQYYNSIILIYAFFVLEIIIIIYLIERILKKQIYYIYFYIVITVSQNLIIGLGGFFSKNTNNVTFLLLFKEIAALIILTTIVIINVIIKKKKIKIYSFDICLLFFVIWLLVEFIRSDANIFTKLSYGRNFAFIAILYLIGRIIDCDIEDLKKLLNFIVDIAVVIAALGIIEWIFFNSHIWLNVFHVDRVYMAKTLSRYDKLLKDGLPLMWYTKISGVYFKRLVSIFFMEPVNLSYFFALAYLILIYIFKNKNDLLNILVRVIIGIAFILTFGKGGILVFCLSPIFLLAFYRFGIKSYAKVVITASICIIGVIVLTFGFIKDSAMPHFLGLISLPISLINNPWGHGLGYGGNFARIYGDIVSRNEWLASGGESALGTIAYQLGVPGLLLITLFFILISYRLYVQACNFEKGSFINKFGLIISGLTILLFLGALFQENAFSPHATGTIIIIMGVSINILLKSNESGDEKWHFLTV